MKDKTSERVAEYLARRPLYTLLESYETERAARHYTPLTVCKGCGLLHGAIQCRRCAAMASAIVRPTPLFTSHFKTIKGGNP